MNEQNGQVDIEQVKDEFRSAVDWNHQNGEPVTVLWTRKARALLAHLERLEGVVPAAEKYRAARQRFDSVYDAWKAAQYPGEQHGFIDQVRGELGVAERGLFRAALATLDPAPPVDAADTKEGEHG